MNAKWIITPFLALAILFGGVTLARAQGFDEPDEGPPGGMQKHEKLRERIELMAMWKLTDALDLDQETAAKVFPMLNDFNKQQQKSREKRREIIKGMKAEIEKKKTDSATLRKMIEEFKKNEIEIVEFRNKKLDDLSKILSEEQVAKMIVFVPEFERNVRQMIDEVRTRRHEREEKQPFEGEPGKPPMRGRQEQPLPGEGPPPLE